MKITKIMDQELGFKTLFEDNSPLPSKSKDDYPGENYADVPNQFRLWIECFDKYKKPTDSIQVIGYDWDVMSKDKYVEHENTGDSMNSSGAQLDAKTFYEMMNHVRKISGKKLAPRKTDIISYRYSGDISLHSDNGSEFCT
jgi:hypothetical protein